MMNGLWYRLIIPPGSWKRAVVTTVVLPTRFWNHSDSSCLPRADTVGTP